MKLSSRIIRKFSCDATRSLHASVFLSKTEVEVKSFDDIPEVKGYPVIGTTLDYTPGRGFAIDEVYELWRKRHKEYGHIYKEKVHGAAGYMVFCNSSDDVTTMFLNDEKCPVRAPAAVVTRIKEKAGLMDGFFNFSGEKWYKIRKLVNPLLLQNNTVWRYCNDQREVCRDLIKYIGRKLDESGEVPDFRRVLDRWAFEMSVCFIMDHRMGLLNNEGSAALEDLLESNDKMMSLIGKSLHGFQLWRYFNTKELVDAIDGLKAEVNYLRPIIEEHLKDIPDKDEEQTIMQKIMSAPYFTQMERFSVLMDLSLGAIDTTSKGASLVLYCLTLNQESQDKLRKEIFQFLENEELTGRSLGNLTYMNAFLKEVFRLTPMSFVFDRFYNKDIVLSGYHIPAGNHVLNTANSTQNMNSELFPDPEKFIPERWLSSGDRTAVRKLRNTLTGPFGFGARACPGRRFAMQEIRLLLVELLSNFNVEYHHSPIHSIFRATGAPSEPPQFKFSPIECRNVDYFRANSP